MRHGEAVAHTLHLLTCTYVMATATTLMATTHSKSENIFGRKEAQRIVGGS
jgi:hypothetical protein